MMDARCCFLFCLVVLPVVLGVWRSSDEDRATARHLRRGIHSHSKRHMLPVKQEVKKTTPKPRELRKKPSGHLAPLEDDDMDNDEVVSVAIGPPPIRPKYDKVNWKHNPIKQANSSKVNNSFNNNAVHFVRDVLTQLGREFLQHQVNEDYVFGQYVGNSMRNLTLEARLNMQHDILDIIVKYQKISRGEAKVVNETSSSEQKMKDEVEKLTKTFDQQLKETKIEKKIISHPHNDTEEGWPDFSNLEKIVG